VSRELLQALLVWARVLPLGLALSTFSRALVPSAVGLSLTLALAAALIPAAGAGPELLGVAALVLALLRELAIGATFALALALALLSIPWAVSLSAGAEMLAPLRRTLETPYALCAGWLVLSLGAARAIVTGLAESFRDAPLAGAVLSTRAFALGAAQLVTDAVATAFGFALPLLVALWLMSFTLAALRRALLPSALAQQPAVAGLLATLAAALLLVPIASRAPEAVRHAIEVARLLTRGFAR